MADALRAEGADVAFIGGQRAEAELVPAAGFQLHTISVEGLSRSNPLHALRALARAAGAAPRARSLLKGLAADAVLGAGGYIAGPVGVAALSLRIPLVLTEADSHLGLTNRALAPFALRVCLAFPIAGREGPSYRVTGRPVASVAQDRLSARRKLGSRARGDMRARVRRLAGRPLDQHGRRRSIRAGRADASALSRAARQWPARSPRGGQPRSDGADTLPGGYDLREYLDLEDFHEALSAADLVVARAGGSVFEIAAHGLPAILVPYPHAAGDHQSANARWMAQAGAAVVIPDAQLSGERLGGEVAALLADRPRLAAMAAAARTLARPDAAREVADELLAVARR